MSRRQDLSAEEIRALLDYDAMSGEFRWHRDITTGKGRVLAAAGTVAGSRNRGGYVVVGIRGRRYMAHRLAWLHVTGSWPNEDVDHVDGNPGNNSWENLRDVAHVTNLQNQRHAQKGSQSGILGVTWQPSRNKWQARICVMGKQMHLGLFLTATEASLAYVNAKRALHLGGTL